jgi:D-lactate dehydrogenase
VTAWEDVLVIPTEALARALEAAVGSPDQVRLRALDRYALANDASHYLLVPQAVVMANEAAEVGRLLLVSAVHGMPLTFRSGGTSLSGQAVGGGILVDTRRGFRDVQVLDDGKRVRVQPGITVRQLNARLAPFGRKFGPDPASESACTVGGVVANNSSGMACGTLDNAYQTLESITVVLPSGNLIDTGGPDADTRLRAVEPALHDGLLRLRDRIRGNAASVRTIEQQFAIKNTMGYSLNAFVDHSSAADILAHLIVGSEGTLGFIAEAVFRTIPMLPHAATGLLVFDDLLAATGALPDLVATGAATIELLDAASLRVAQADPKADGSLRAIDVRSHAALLVEYQAGTSDELVAIKAGGAAVLAGLPLSVPAGLTSDPAIRARQWHVRKGLYAAIAGARPQGTTALLEDVVVPVDALARTCASLTELFDRYGYGGSVIFGHAKDGNVHFMLTDRFDLPESQDRYIRFTEDMVDLVLGEGGSLKAEHGTGRIMAPYVSRQYGDELYEVMREVKRLFDPAGMLNPGVILNDDPHAHIRHIKSAPRVEPEVDRCVECGFCEPVCPSRDLTTTPRQRIVVRRALAHARAEGDTGLVAELENAYEYDGVQTCAVDGMCQTACPVAINTGDLVKRLRAESHSRTSDRAWAVAARHWSGATRAASAALTAVATVPAPVVRGPNRLARRALGAETVPLWSDDLPSGGRRRARLSGAEPSAVYLPACVNAIFGPADGGAGVQPAFEALCGRAGIALLVPAEVDALCCGNPWSSKGHVRGAELIKRRLRDALVAASDNGRLPVICDASSCTEGLVQALGGSVRVVDAVEFVATDVLPRLPDVAGKLPVIALHPTCSSTRLGLDAALADVAGAVAKQVFQPTSWGCCAFAGDRGMLHPELTASATRQQAAEITAAAAAAHASCNRTCEIGMTRATGRPYRHVLEILAELLGLGADNVG